MPNQTSLSRRSFALGVLPAAIAAPAFGRVSPASQQRSASARGEVPSRARGPVLPGLYADPHIVRFGNTYYIYPTTDGQQWQSTSFKCFSSENLTDWRDEGVILDLRDVSWAESKAWAPAAAEANGKFYFYFTAQDRIGVAVADRPTGPFREAIGRPLVDAGQFETYPIDPMLFTDEDGARYLYFGNGRCLVVRMNDDMVSFDPATLRDVTPRGETTKYNEGAFVLKRGGRYHLTWSVNDTRSPDYQVHAGVADSPLGPFEIADNVPILSRDGPSLGTGHHSIVRLPGEDRWAICFHRFAVPGGDGMNREVCIAPLTFDRHGNMERVDLSALRNRTNEGPVAS